MIVTAPFVLEAVAEPDAEVATFPPESLAVTTGWVPSETFGIADDDGGLVITSVVGAPAVIEIEFETAAVMDPLVVSVKVIV
ncbi:MAG: hypothetical protein KGJ36_01475 [Acidobacteriota bacterium]|nr:hypothetical protein [Acidobacteriota bacterium]